MNETNNLKLNKPDKTDFVSIGDFNANSDKIDALGAPEFDDSGTVNGITDFTTYLSTLVSGTSIFNFFRNLKAGFQYVLHVGQLVNNTVTNNDNLPAAASAVYKLQQSLNTTNSNLTNLITRAQTTLSSAATIGAGSAVKFIVSATTGYVIISVNPFVVGTHNTNVAWTFNSSTNEVIIRNLLAEPITTGPIRCDILQLKL